MLPHARERIAPRIRQTVEKLAGEDANAIFGAYQFFASLLVLLYIGSSILR
jgi:hypothetical protein